MTNPERAELDILRAEKSKWEALREEDRTEKARLLQELNDLRSQNAEMVENHTRDLLQLKAKETQLARSRNDAELTQAALSKAQRDLEALRASSHGESSQREMEMWRSRAERAETRVVEREELDANVLARLTDLEEFIRGLDDGGEGVDGAEIVSRLSSRAGELEEQNRRLLAQAEEYSVRLTTLEDVRPPAQDHSSHLSIPPLSEANGVEFEATDDISVPKWQLDLFSTLLTLLWLRRRKREFLRSAQIGVGRKWLSVTVPE